MSSWTPRTCAARKCSAGTPPDRCADLRHPAGQASKKPLAWRHLLSHGLPGPAKGRRAYAEQNAPLLLFFRLPICRNPLTRATARLLLVVLPSSNCKSIFFIWLSRAELLR